MMLNKPRFWDKKIGVISIILSPLSFLFSILVLLKKIVSKKLSFKIPIVCIGNIYVGGTGKTPTSIFIANQIKQLGAKPAIVRSHHSNHEDEYHLIRNSFKDLILNQNRVDAIKSAEKLNYDILILDDGLQDYRIKKSLSIACFNSNQLIGNGMIFPAGPLREKLSALEEVDIVLINGEKNENFEKKILKINKKLEIFYSSYRAVNIDKFRNKKFLAVAGIGNPENFFKLLESNNLKIEKKLIFPDHYKFSKEEILKIVDEANKNHYKILMTEKDYYKIKNFKIDTIEYLKISIKIENQEKLIAKIRNLNG